VNEWSGVFLGLIALAVCVMAAIQVGVVIFGARLARRVETIAGQVDREIKPLIANLTTVSQEAARAAELAAVQVDRVDALFADVAERVESTAADLQSAILGPAREGMALIRGVKAAYSAIREMRSATAPARAARHDEDDPLFIG
jgi:hypothetical protein